MLANAHQLESRAAPSARAGLRDQAELASSANVPVSNRFSTSTNVATASSCACGGHYPRYGGHASRIQRKQQYENNSAHELHADHVASNVVRLQRHASVHGNLNRRVNKPPKAAPSMGDSIATDSIAEQTVNSPGAGKPVMDSVLAPTSSVLQIDLPTCLSRIDMMAISEAQGSQAADLQVENLLNQLHGIDLSDPDTIAQVAQRISECGFSPGVLSGFLHRVDQQTIASGGPTLGQQFDVGDIGP